MTRPNDHDKIASRLAIILTKLNAGERLNPAALAEEFNVTLRTIQRDLNVRFSYLPLQKENGCYFLEPYALGKLSFEDIKSFAALSGTRGLFPSLDNRFITELLGSRIGAAYLVKHAPYEDLTPKTELFAQLTRAVLERRSIAFEYHGKSRNANPYKLVNNAGIWYLLADETGRLKHYALSKIADLSLTQNTFKPDDELTRIIRENRQNWFSQNRIEVMLEVEGVAIEHFLRRDLLPDQRVLERTPQKLTLATTVAFEDEILRIVRYWMPHIRIVSPETLRENLRVGLENYLADA